MIIELQWVWYPGSWGEEQPCGICREQVVPEGIAALISADAPRYDLGLACSRCVELFGAHLPGKAPTVEEYREALRRYPRPMYESEAALEAASRAVDPTVDPVDFVYDESWIWRVSEEQARA